MKKGEMAVMEQLFLSTLGLDPAVGTLGALSVGLADLCPVTVCYGSHCCEPALDTGQKSATAVFT